MCLTGNGDVPHREWGCASPGMGMCLTGMHILTGNAHSLYRVNMVPQIYMDLLWNYSYQSLLKVTASSPVQVLLSIEVKVYFKTFRNTARSNQTYVFFLMSSLPIAPSVIESLTDAAARKLSQQLYLRKSTIDSWVREKKCQVGSTWMIELIICSQSSLPSALRCTLFSLCIQV